MLVFRLKKFRENNDHNTEISKRIINMWKKKTSFRKNKRNFHINKHIFLINLCFNNFQHDVPRVENY